MTEAQREVMRDAVAQVSRHVVAKIKKSGLPRDLVRLMLDEAKATTRKQCLAQGHVGDGSDCGHIIGNEEMEKAFAEVFPEPKRMSTDEILHLYDEKVDKETALTIEGWQEDKS